MDPTVEHVTAVMKAAKVTSAEAMAFMGEALCRQERDRPGIALAFVQELIERRGKR